MKINYTKHAAVEKFKWLKDHGFAVSRTFVSKAIKTPDHADNNSDFPNTIVSKSLDQKHILRVVYRKENDTITIITFYPAKKDRYS